MKFSPTIKVTFQSLNVNSIDTVSGILIGTNLASQWSSHNKNNMGFGRMTGYDNQTTRPRTYLIDNDAIDTWIDDRDVFTSWTKRKG